jgi:hypothetical protein
VNNNRITNGYLNDSNNAWKFYQDKLNTAQELMEQIFMVTSGHELVDRSVKQTDWAQENMLMIFEMFMIRHKNFNVRSFTEDLQQRIFISTKDRSEAYSKWRAQVFTGQGLDDDGEPLAENNSPGK